jgi:hypothetical protein
MAIEIMTRARAKCDRCGHTHAFEAQVVLLEDPWHKVRLGTIPEMPHGWGPDYTYKCLCPSCLAPTRKALLDVILEDQEGL